MSADGVPTFRPTSSPELDDVLLTFREKYFIPAYVSKPERRRIFGTKFKTQLEQNPISVEISNETIPLKWIDRRTERPRRNRLFDRAVDLMAAGEPADWKNLPALFVGLQKETNGKEVGRRMLAGVVRRACKSGQLRVVLECFQRAEETGCTLKASMVLRELLWGVRDVAQVDNWSEESVARALKAANEVALLLEKEEHGADKLVHADDARTRPEVVAVFAELQAVYSYKFLNQKDTNGTVKVQIERLVDCLASKPEYLSADSMSTRIVEAKGLEDEPDMPLNKAGLVIMENLAIWHSLSLAEKILQTKMPRRELAGKVRREYEQKLSELAEKLEKGQLEEGSIGERGLLAWRACLRE